MSTARDGTRWLMLEEEIEWLMGRIEWFTAGEAEPVRGLLTPGANEVSPLHEAIYTPSAACIYT